MGNISSLHACISRIFQLNFCQKWNLKPKRFIVHFQLELLSIDYSCLVEIRQIHAYVTIEPHFLKGNLRCNFAILEILF